VSESAATAPSFEIPGPAAVGSDRHRFWSLLWLTSKVEFRLRYHGSILGYVWTLLNPLLFFGVIYVFFTQVIDFGHDIEHYAALLLFNIMLFHFFTGATNGSVSSLVKRERMLRSTDFPRLVIPVSGVVTSLFVLLVGLPVAFFYLLGDGGEPTWTWLLLPVLVALLFAFTLGVSLLISTLYVTLRDVSQIWTVATRALFYATPVIYPIERVPVDWRDLAYLNPMAPILTQLRNWVVDPSAPNAIDAAGPLGLLPSVFTLVTVLGLGFWLFIRRAPRVAELL
jgi:ABC-2 type transport system permease protein